MDLLKGLDTLCEKINSKNVNFEVTCELAILKESLEKNGFSNIASLVYGLGKNNFNNKEIVEKPGYVYFLKNTETSLVKIGYTTNFKSRLQTLNCSTAFPLSLLGFKKGSFGLEKYFHNIFDSLRVKGEWFKLTSKDLFTIGNPTRDEIPIPTLQKWFKAFNKRNLGSFEEYLCSLFIDNKNNNVSSTTHFQYDDNQIFDLIRSLEKRSPLVKDQVKEFIALTGMSRKTYFNKKQKMRSCGSIIKYDAEQTFDLIRTLEKRFPLVKDQIEAFSKETGLTRRSFLIQRAKFMNERAKLRSVKVTKEEK